MAISDAVVIGMNILERRVIAAAIELFERLRPDPYARMDWDDLSSHTQFKWKEDARAVLAAADFFEAEYQEKGRGELHSATTAR